MKNEKAIAAMDSLISNQLNIINLTGKKDNITLSVPTVDTISEDTLLKILKSKFSNHSEVGFSFSHFISTAANPITIIQIQKNNN